MKKEIIITIITILVIIAGDLVSQNYTKKCVSETVKNLNELKSIVLNKQSDGEEKNESQKIYDKWREESKGLAYYIEHNELEKIDVQMKIITADLEADVSDDSISEIEEAIYLLHHIEEKRALKLKNIF